MEVKINREIRKYTESIFLGLSIRQFIFSLCACFMAVILYFLLKDKFNTEALSWICITGAAPFAALGFISYNGLSAEQLLYNYLKSQILRCRKLTDEPKNYYYELLRPIYQNTRKEK